VHALVRERDLRAGLRVAAVDAVVLTVTSTLFQASTAEASVFGAVLSILTVGLSALVWLPALSDTDAVAVRA